MTVSLLSLPDELFLMIFDVGNLGFEDAVAFTLTCNRLYIACNCKAFWFVIAETMRRAGIVIATPLFEALQVLSESDLRRACERAHGTAINLKADAPVLRRCRELVLPDGTHVRHFVLLHGGRHIIVVTSSHQVQLWDLEPKESEAGGGSVIEASESRPPRLLASHESRINPRTIDYSIVDLPNKEVVVAGIIESDDFEGLWIHVFSFRFGKTGPVNSNPAVSSQDYGLTNLAHQSLHAPSIRFQEYGIVAYGYVPNYDGAGNDVLDIAFLDYRHSAFKRLQTDIVMPTDADAYEIVMHGTDIVIFLATSAGIHLYTYFNYFGQHMEDSDRSYCRLAPDWREVLPWDAAADLAENGAWFPTLPWNVPCKATGGLVPVQCTALERIAEGGPVEGVNENNWRPIFFPQWLDPKMLIEHSNGRIQEAGCNRRWPIRLPHQTWVSRSMLEMLKTSTCGLYMLWIGSRPDAGRLLAELHLIRLPAPATLDQGLGFEQSSTRLEIPLPLEDVSYTAFSEESGLLALAVEREGEVTNKVHLFYY